MSRMPEFGEQRPQGPEQTGAINGGLAPEGIVSAPENQQSGFQRKGLLSRFTSPFSRSKDTSQLQVPNLVNTSEVHPASPEPESLSERNTITRRRFMEVAATLGAGAGLGALIAACGGSGSAEGSTPKAAAPNTDSSDNTEVATPTPKAPEPSPTPEVFNPKTLKEAAARSGFNIGVYKGNYGHPEAQAQLGDIQTSEFNLALIAFQRPIYNPQPDVIDLSYLEGNVNDAVRKGMKIIGHAPAFGASGVPQSDLDPNLSADVMSSRMVKAIKEPITHFKDRIHTWTVVNEYDSQFNLKDVYLRKLGPGYLELAYQTAREADNLATLLYNDGIFIYGQGDKVNENTKQVVERLKNQNLIDGVGAELHLNGKNPPTKQEMIEGIRSYGLPVYVTEFDVDMRDVPGSDADRFARQAQIYGDALSAAIESGVCKDFVVFGVSDNLSWLESGKGSSPKADPLPFDDNFQKKPAYYAMMDALKIAASQTK